MSLRSHIHVLVEIWCARLRGLMWVRPEATELISALAAIAWAVSVWSDPSGIALSSSYQILIGWAQPPVWVVLFGLLGAMQISALLSWSCRYRLAASLIGVIAWGCMGAAVAVAAPSVPTGWVYLTLALACVWAALQISYHHGRLGGGCA